ncbi:UNVERIFIED_CONTAM: hypothetical protein K2H54_023479 [Gekko kuhli]
MPEERIYSSGREPYFNLNSTWYDPAGSWLDTRRKPFRYADNTCCVTGCKRRDDIPRRGGHDYRCYGYRRSTCKPGEDVTVVAVEEEEYVLSPEDMAVEEEGYAVSQEDTAVEEEWYVVSQRDVEVEDEGYHLTHVLLQKDAPAEGDVVDLQEGVAVEEQGVALSHVLHQEDAAVEEEEEYVLSQEDVAVEEEEYVLNPEDVAAEEEEYVLNLADAAVEEEEHVLHQADAVVEEEGYVLSRVADFLESSGDLGDHPVEDVKEMFFVLIHELWLVVSQPR